ncbi:MAG: ABC-F family ATP-binding cassette domain-containing protein [Eubacteriales bacterium]
MPLLSVQQISKTYHSRKLLDHVSFTVDAGDRMALIGSNGAGKTTLFRMIEGKVPPDDGCIIQHSHVIIGYLSQNLEDQDAGDNALKSREILDLEDEMANLEHQLSDPNRQDMTSLLEKYAKITARYEACGGYDFEQRMREVLAGLGLTSDDLLRPVTSLSGGERMRVSLARLIVQRPDLLLLDEPTNHLDTQAMEWLEEYLQKYSGAVLLISHDRYFIDRTASNVIELENGQIKSYKGNYTAYCMQKEQFISDQRQLVSQLEKEVERQAGVTQTMLSHRKMSAYHAREKVVSKLSDRLSEEKRKLSGGPMRMSFTFVPEKRDGDPDKILLQARNLGKAFPDCEPLFENVNFQIKATDKFVLVGPNGCGKTTLLSILLGQVAEFDGDVLISSQAECGYMGQFIPFVDEERTVLDELFTRTELTETQARNLLARFGFREIDVYKKIKVLSGGERSRLYLCCLLQESPDILFLDEPTNHLDIQSREILEGALAEYTGAVLAVSHDRYFIDKCSKGVLGFIDSQVLPYENFSQYRTAEKAALIRRLTKPSMPEKSQNQNSPEILPETKYSSRGTNRTKERRDAALRKERLRALEKEIEELENMQKEMESSFSKETRPEEYAEYAANTEKLSSVYDEYINLSEDDEE